LSTIRAAAKLKEQEAAEQKVSDEAAEKLKEQEEAAPKTTSAEHTKAPNPVETTKVDKSCDIEAAAVKQAECCIIC
jgi:hypothetical protein